MTKQIITVTLQAGDIVKDGARFIMITEGEAFADERGRLHGSFEVEMIDSEDAHYLQQSRGAKVWVKPLLVDTSGEGHDLGTMQPELSFA